MKFADQLVESLKSKNRSTYDWIFLLNYFELHCDEMDVELKIKIYRKCEYLRTFFNLSTRTYKKGIHDHVTGETLWVKNIATPLNIEACDVVPDTMYNDKDVLDQLAIWREEDGT